MKILLAFILLASSLASTTVSASEIQVVHSNDKPSKCEFGAEKKVMETCSSFKLLKQGKVYWFTYYFDKSPISFVAVPVEAKEDVVAFVVGQLYYDGKLHDVKTPGVCTMSKRFYFSTCSVNNFEIYYSP